MLKFFSLALANTIVLLLTTPAWSRTVPTDSLCYMQTANGQLISLDRLCTPVLPRSTAVANPHMVVDRVNYDGQQLQGVVTNQTGEPVSKVTINYTLVDAHGKELDAGLITQRVALAPGDSLPFERVSPHLGATVRIEAIDWTL